MNEFNDDDDNSDFIGFSPIKLKTSISEDASQDVISEDDIAQANARAKLLHVYKPGINFVVGAKLECLESRDNKWYECKIVEVDWGELDVLVHYNRWSKKFDEWLKMDCTRIRPYSALRKSSKPNFVVNEKVLGFWALDSKYYLGEVVRISSDDFYEVKFYDGYSKTLRPGQIRKISKKEADSYQKTLLNGVIGIPMDNFPPKIRDRRRSSQKSVSQASTSSITPLTSEIATTSSEVQNSQSKVMKGWAYVPEVPDTSGKNIFNVEIIQQKRKTKRKPEVEQLFPQTKKKRKLEDAFESDKSFTEPSPNISNVTSPSVQKPLELVSSTPLSVEPVAKKRRLAGRPAQTLEIDLGLNWKKVCSKKSGNKKWETFYLTPENKKLCNRSQFIQNYQKMRSPITPADIDFTAKMFKLEYEAKYGGVQIKVDQSTPSVVSSETSFSGIYEELNVSKSVKEESSESSSSDSSSSDSSSDESSDANDESVSSKESLKDEESSDSDGSTDSDDSSDSNDDQFMTNLPSVKLSQMVAGKSPEELSNKEVSAKETFEGFVSTVPKKFYGSISKSPTFQSAGSSPVSSPVEMKSDNIHLCSKKGCEKSFRKESLLQMHMKHYHPELAKKNRLSSITVADLASTRILCDSPSSKTGADSLDSFPTSPSCSSFDVNSSRKSSEGKIRPKTRSTKDQPSQNDSIANESGNEPELEEPEIESNPRSILAKKKAQMLLEKEGVTTRRSLRSETLSEFDDETVEPQSDGEPDAIINCGCKSNEEDGLMLQCDTCLCWQHGACYNIEREDQVPDSYICSLCENPRGQRSSMQFRHHQTWLKEGRLPRLSISSDKRNTKLESFIKMGNELSANMLQLSPLVHSLRLKLNIAKEIDHPKLVMWHKEWTDESENEVKEQVPHSTQPLSTRLLKESSSSLTVANMMDETIPTPMSLSTPFIPPSFIVDADKNSVQVPPHSMANPFVEVSSHSRDIIAPPGVDISHKPEFQTNEILDKNVQPMSVPTTSSSLTNLVEKTETKQILDVPTTKWEGEFRNWSLNQDKTESKCEVSWPNKELVEPMEGVKESEPAEDKMEVVSTDPKPGVDTNEENQISETTTSVPVVEDTFSSTDQELTNSNVENSVFTKDEGMEGPINNTENDCREDNKEPTIIDRDAISSEKQESMDVDEKKLEVNEERNLNSEKEVDVPKEKGSISPDIQSGLPHTESDIVSANEEIAASTSSGQQIAASNEEQIAASTSSEQPIAASSERQIAASNDQPIAASTSSEQQIAVSSEQPIAASTSSEQQIAASNEEQIAASTSSEQPIAASSERQIAASNDQPIAASTSSEQQIAVSSEQPIAASTSSEQQIAASTSSELQIAASSEQPIAASTSSEQQIAASTSSELQIAASSEQPIAASTSSEQQIAASTSSELQIAASSEQPIAASTSSEQQIAASTSSEQQIAASSEQPIATSTSSKQQIAASSEQPIAASTSSGQQIAASNEERSSCLFPEKEITSNKEAIVAASSTAVGLEGTDSKSDKNNSEDIKGSDEVPKVNSNEPMEESHEMDTLVATESQPLVEHNEIKKLSVVVPTNDSESKEEETLEATDDFDIELGGLGASSVPDMNDLLSHSAFDQFVPQENPHLAPLEQPMTAPIIPEAERIEPAKCKVNLLKHVEKGQNDVMKRFDLIERQLQSLEADMGLTSEISKEEEELLMNDDFFERDPATIQARSLVQLLLSNFTTVSKMASYDPVTKNPL